MLLNRFLTTTPTPTPYTDVLEFARDMSKMLNNEYKKNDVFADLRNYISYMTSGALGIIMLVGLNLLAASCFYAAFRFSKGTVGDRAEGKKKIAYIFYALAGLFLLSAIVIFIKNMVEGVVSGT